MERQAIILDHQNGHHDDTCKPVAETTLQIVTCDLQGSLLSTKLLLTIVDLNDYRGYQLLIFGDKGVVSKGTVVLRRWGSCTQKLGFINGVDNVN